MTDVAIRIENVSKRYRLGRYGAETFKEELRSWWTRRAPAEHPRDLWALRDIHLEIRQGEVLGFVGRNGAGKTTLLKLISRITLPTSGRILGRGKLATLLEVGTGFHQDLTGRENIFLSGAILGMSQRDIRARFDEIVAFSGVEAFLDTPVKRYSSGMYVRLAFSVAAHLEPDILVVDEVLAVGDAAFQRKCLGKMKEVSRHSGRTILFVSHHMQALANLCTRAVCLDKGILVDEGAPDRVIAGYLKREQVQFLLQEYPTWEEAPGTDLIRLRRAALLPDYLPGMDIIDIRTPLDVQLEFWLQSPEPLPLIVGVQVHALTGECIFDVGSEQRVFAGGLLEARCRIPGRFLNDGSYYISISFVRDTTNRLLHFDACLSFDVEDYRAGSAWFGKWLGYVRPDFPVSVTRKEGDPA